MGDFARAHLLRARHAAMAFALAAQLCARGAGQEAPVKLSLSALVPDSAIQGWGSLETNRSVGGNPLRIAGREFAAGLGTHAISEITYDLDGRFEQFESWVGVDDEMKGHTESSVEFQVFGDGRKLFDSGVMRLGDAARLARVPLAGVSQLKLVVTDAGDGINCDHADWADARLTGGQPGPSEAAGETKYEVAASGITACLDANGNLVRLLSGENHNWNLAGRTRLAGCRAAGAVIAKKLSGGGYAFTRDEADAEGHRCRVTDRFVPGRNSIRWEIEIFSDDAPWSTAIETRLNCAAGEQTRFWTAWADPEHRSDAWRDPLVLRPMENAAWSYSNLGESTPVRGDFISLPLATLAEPGRDAGASIVLSPEDANLELWLRTTGDGSIRFTRLKQRLGGGRTARFATDLVAHEADWRGGLRWLVARYPGWFDPPNPRADQMAGCGAYSGDEEPIDAAKFKRMAFRINWKLSDDFPYMGMFIPPVKDAAQRWRRSCDESAPPGKPDWTSCARLNDYARYMKTNGFYVLDYFNVTEFGKKMGTETPAKPADLLEIGKTSALTLALSPRDREQTAGGEPWADPRVYVKSAFPADAVLLPGAATFYGASVMDVGNPAYQKFILEQAARYIRFVPDSAGICIDRLDWLARFNPKGDDGVSWVDGKPARSLFASWQSLVGKLGPLMHRAGKVIFINPINTRLDWMREVDGVYTEFGQCGTSLNGSAWLCLRKPMLAWSYNETLRQPDPDSFFQRHLLLGAYPTAPYPWNNHCIQPEPSAEKFYLDYGPLLDAMRGKKWVLEAHCVESATPGVKVNLFKVPGGYALPVTFGANNSTAVVRLRNVKGLASMRCEALHPGAAAPSVVRTEFKDGILELTVPLVRGCAMVKASPAGG